MRALRGLVAAVAVTALAIGAVVSPTVDLPPPALAVSETVVRTGETLSGALRRTGLPSADVVGIIGVLRGEIDMRRVQPGTRLATVWSRDGQLLAVTYWPTLVEGRELRRAGDGWRARRVVAPLDTRVVRVAGVIEDSLFSAIDGLNETPALAAKLVSLFEWDFDFAADALRGDRFRLLVEKQFVGGQFVGYGEILIAQYESVGRPLVTALAFEVSPGKPRYFDADGRSVRKMFLRAPLDFTRVTSGYSHARKHPILGGARPHLAVDYGAPRGTPVRAVADGIVEYAGRRGGNGLSIMLRHARGYKTMYNHLSRVAVRARQRVKQRQIIGRVGSTGLATGPHLDYRVMKNGRFVNPLSERFTPGAPVPADRLPGFREHLARLLERLERPAPAGPSA